MKWGLKNDSFMGLYPGYIVNQLPRYKERWVPGPSSTVILRLSERLGRCRVELHYGTVYKRFHFLLSSSGIWVTIRSAKQSHIVRFEMDVVEHILRHSFCLTLQANVLMDILLSMVASKHINPFTARVFDGVL